VFKKPQPDFGHDLGICKGGSLQLDPGEFASYLWQDSSRGKTFTAKQPGLYSVVVTNSCGAAKAEVLLTEKECGMYFPNAFTPNGDGVNDYFKILSSYQFQEYHLSVFNRWGQKVFETTDALKGWDGTLNGKKQSTSVFAWECSYKKSDVVGSMKGTVVLIR
jgi:gliding motility-associated-like protein